MASSTSIPGIGPPPAEVPATPRTIASAKSEMMPFGVSIPENQIHEADCYLELEVPDTKDRVRVDLYQTPSPLSFLADIKQSGRYHLLVSDLYDGRPLTRGELTKLAIDLYERLCIAYSLSTAQKKQVKYKFKDLTGRSRSRTCFGIRKTTWKGVVSNIERVLARLMKHVLDVVL